MPRPQQSFLNTKSVRVPLKGQGEVDDVKTHPNLVDIKKKNSSEVLNSFYQVAHVRLFKQFK